MKEVELFRIVHSDRTTDGQMYLRELGGGRFFPIVISIFETLEIHRKVHGMPTRRPMTHDLFAALLKELGAELRSVEITELKDEIFHARMNLVHGSREFTLDARPSDAVALATGTGARIFVDESILDAIGMSEPSPGASEGRAGEQ